MALGCSETVVATHVTTLYGNSEAKANVLGPDRLCVALIGTPAFALLGGISVIPFNKANSPLTHLHTGFRPTQTTLLTAQLSTFKIFRH